MTISNDLSTGDDSHSRTENNVECITFSPTDGFACFKSSLSTPEDRGEKPDTGQGLNSAADDSAYIYDTWQSFRVITKQLRLEGTSLDSGPYAVLGILQAAVWATISSPLRGTSPLKRTSSSLGSNVKSPLLLLVVIELNSSKEEDLN